MSAVQVVGHTFGLILKKYDIMWHRRKLCWEGLFTSSWMRLDSSLTHLGALLEGSWRVLGAFNRARPPQDGSEEKSAEIKQRPGEG